MYKSITGKIFEELKHVTDKEYILTDEYNKDIYSKDNTEDLKYYPDVIIRPGSTSEISKILKIANFYKIPVTPRGGGTGLSGGSLPVFGGICLSLERMNKILEIDENNFQITAEPGVITEVLQSECEKRGLFYPVDPASKGSCFIGGNLAESSGGPRAVKYGTTKDYVLSIEVVLPSGEILNLGTNTLKNVSGYNLTQLIIGSEGTLGIITRITLRLTALPKFRKVALIAYDDIYKCISSVAEIFKQGLIPSALEFMERDAIKTAEEHLSKVYPNSDAEAQLLVEFDGNNEEVIFADIEKCALISEKYDAADVIMAEDTSKIEEIWSLRRAVGESVKNISVYMEEDTVVPRFRLPDLLIGVKEICTMYGIRAICYGHAGDGNLHINILKDGLSDDEWEFKTAKAIPEIFKLTVRLGGSISGEHGIGLTQKKYLNIAVQEKVILLMKEIKKIFDPNNILNPGKIFDL
ncbi:MAG: FAD-binding protein [Ignavibacteria bacterium]|nr:FAD-binding protein [Ignavibacteria bacterium]